MSTRVLCVLIEGRSPTSACCRVASRSATAASRCATAFSAAAAALVRLARSLSAAAAALSLRRKLHTDAGSARFWQRTGARRGGHMVSVVNKLHLDSIFCTRKSSL